MAWANDTRPLPALGSQVVGEEIFEISKDEIYFPAALSPAQRRIVHQSAENTGLFHATIDEKEGKRVCVSRALKENSGEIATNPIPKPVTPHAALLISDEQAVGLKALVSAPHNPAVARYMQYIQRVCAVGADVKDLSGCDVDLSRHPCVFVDTVEGLYGKLWLYFHSWDHCLNAVHSGGRAYQHLRRVRIRSGDALRAVFF